MSTARPPEDRLPGRVEPSRPCLRTDHVFQRILEIRNVVPQAPFLVEHPCARPTRADLRRMRNARGRTQGLVLDPPRPGRDGATEDGGAAGLAPATHRIKPPRVQVRLPHERGEPRALAHQVVRVNEIPIYSVQTGPAVLCDRSRADSAVAESPNARARPASTGCANHGRGEADSIART